MKRDYTELIVSIMLMFFSGFPLIEIVSKSLVIDQISNFSLIVIVVWLIIILISSIIYFVSYWMEKFDQLHFKGAVYTVPKIYQVRGLHNSSSLYKITHYGALGRVSAVSKKGVKTRRKTAIWTCSSVGQSNRLIIWRSQVQALAGPQQMIPCIYKSRIVNTC